MRVWRVVEGGRAAGNGMSTWTLHELGAAERALLTGTRRWFQDGTARAMAAMRDGLSVAAVPNTALLPMFAMLGTFAVHGAIRPDMLSPNMLAVSADEAALLDAIAAVQAGESDHPQRLLGRWLPAPALILASDAMGELAGILSAAGIRLRRRRPARLVAPARAAE